MFFGGLKTIYLFLIITVILLLIFFNFDLSKNLFFSLFQWPLKLFNWLGLKIIGGYDFIINWSTVFKENTELKSENSQIKLENIHLKETAAENKDLRKAFELGLDKEKKMLTAKVLGQSWLVNQNLIIDRGSNDGLKNDLAIISTNGGLVGRIVETNRYFSKVLLISDPNSAIAAVIQNDSRSQGLVKGQHGLSLAMEMLPLEDKIERGQVIVANGMANFSAQGLPIGEVEEIILKENDVFQRALIKPLVDFRRLETVLVILDEKY